MINRLIVCGVLLVTSPWLLAKELLVAHTNEKASTLARLKLQRS